MNILQFRLPILLIAALALGAALYFIPNLQADYSFEKFFPKGDTDVAFFEQYTEDFGADKDLLMLALPHQPNVFDSLFLLQLDSLSHLLQNEATIRQVLSMSNATEFRRTPFGLVEIPLLKNTPKGRKKAQKHFLADPRTRKLLLSEDLQTTALLLQVRPGLGEAQSDSLIEIIKSHCEALELEEYHLGGQRYTEASYIRMLETENIQLIPLFMIMVVLVLLFLYRSFISIIVPTFSVLLGLILLYGYAAAIGRSFNLSTLMYPTVMAVVGMSDLIHLYTKYQTELEEGHDRKTAILRSLVELRVTLFLTSLTTIIGFLAIARSSIAHLQTYGADAAVGVAMAYIIAITFTPVMLSYLPASRSAKSSINWQGVSNWVYQQTRQNPRILLLLSALVLLLSCWGIGQIDRNNYILGSINDDAPLKQDYLFFEEELSGVRAFEMSVSTQGDYTFDDLAVLQELEKLESYLDTIEVIGPIFSPLTFYKTAQSIEKGKGLSGYQLPKDDRGLRRLAKWESRIDFPYISQDRKRGRMSAKMRDIGRENVEALQLQIDEWIVINISSDILQFRPTGASLLMDKTNQHLVRQMLESLLLAFVVVSIIVAWVFRSWMMVLISLIPNVLPLLFTAGVMGLFGVELNGSTAIIFTIAFVIAVDDTIHFLMKFQQERKKDKPFEAALKTTLEQTGKAIIITSLVLMSGYAILLFSDFREAWYHGVLICFTMLGALVADLFLIPILLRKLYTGSIDATEH